MKRDLVFFLTGVAVGFTFSQFSCSPAFCAPSTRKEDETSIASSSLRATTAGEQEENDGSHSDLLSDARWELAMLKLRAPRIYGPSELPLLSPRTKDQYAEYGMRMVRRGFMDGTGGASSFTQVPDLAANIMTRVNDCCWVKEWSAKLLDTLIGAVKEGQDISPGDYPGSAIQIQKALAKHVVPAFEGKNVNLMVGGSISPWVESIALGTLPDVTVTTVDYQPVNVSDPRIRVLSMTELMSKRPAKLFDVIISYSSLEHDGLGRYGDPLDPYGDFAAMAEYYVMLNPGGFVLLGLPYEDGGGRIVGNSVRMYNPDRIKKMTEGYRTIEMFPPPEVQRYWQYQPLWVLKKTTDDAPFLMSIS